MSKKLEIYEKALESIRDLETGTQTDIARRIARTALEEGEFEGEDRGATVAKIADIVIAKELVFGSAEEIADAVNAAGMTTSRGKAWTKSSVTRYMGDVRVSLQRKLLAAVTPVVATAPTTETVEVTIANVPADCETLSVSVQPAVEEVVDPHPEVTAAEHAEAEASPLPVALAVSIDPELAEIEELVSAL